MKIIELYAESVKRIKAIQIRPKGNVVWITGKNEQGKTSVLDSIWFALGGKDAFSDTPRPIRDGQKEALISLDLGHMIVTRHWTSNERSYLKVENKEGEKFDKPQELIDSFLGRLSFDPLEFSALSQRDQRDTLLDLADLRELLASLDTQKAELYEQRTLLGRDLSTTEAQLDESELPPNLPKEEVSISKLTEEYEVAVSHNSEIREHTSKKELQQRRLADDDVRVKDLQAEIEQLNVQIADIQEQSKARLETINECDVFLHIHPAINTAAIKIKLNEADELNQFIRSAQRTAVLKETASKLKLDIAAHTEQLSQVDKTKTKALSKAQMPIEGLGLDDDGVTYDGMPFSQIGSSNQLKVSMAIAMAMNPKLRVIRIQRGNDLDEDNQAIIEKMAKDNDFQLWVEKVSKDGKTGFYIEDGELVDQKEDQGGNHGKSHNSQG